MWLIVINTGATLFLQCPQISMDPISTIPNTLMCCHWIRKFHEAKVNSYPFVEVWRTGMPRNSSMLTIYLNTLRFPYGKLCEKQFLNILWWRYKRHRTHKMIKSYRISGDIRFNTSKPDGTARKLLDSRTRIPISLKWKAKIELKNGILAPTKFFSKGLGQHILSSR